MNIKTSLTSAIAVIIIFCLPLNVLSQDEMISFRISTSKYLSSDNNLFLNKTENYGADVSAETDRILSGGLILNLSSTKCLELEYENFRFFEKQSIQTDYGSSWVNSVSSRSINVTPLTIAFSQRFLVIKDVSFLYRFGISYYHIRADWSHDISEITEDDYFQTNHLNFNKNTYGSVISLSAVYRLSDQLGLMFVTENRIVNNLDFEFANNPYSTNLDGFVLKAGLEFHIF